MSDLRLQVDISLCLNLLLIRPRIPAAFEAQHVDVRDTWRADDVKAVLSQRHGSEHVKHGAQRREGAP